MYLMGTWEISNQSVSTTPTSWPTNLGFIAFPASGRRQG